MDRQGATSDRGIGRADKARADVLLRKWLTAKLLRTVMGKDAKRMDKEYVVVSE
jgi:hypothetical protein